MPMKIKLYDKETKGYGQVDLAPGKYLFEVSDVPESSAAKSGRGKLQVKLVVAEGPVAGKKVTAFWNLPNSDDPPEHFSRNFWKDIHTAFPSCYDAAKEELDETKLKGIKFHATVSYKEGNSYPQLNSYRWVSEAKGGAPQTSAPSGVEPQKPQKFSTPS